MLLLELALPRSLPAQLGAAASGCSGSVPAFCRIEPPPPAVDLSLSGASLVGLSAPSEPQANTRPSGHHKHLVAAVGFGGEGGCIGPGQGAIQLLLIGQQRHADAQAGNQGPLPAAAAGDRFMHRPADLFRHLDRYIQAAHVLQHHQQFIATETAEQIAPVEPLMGIAGRQLIQVAEQQGVRSRCRC